MKRPYWRCPKCDRESLELEATGEMVYKETVEGHQGKWVVCERDCEGHWLIPGDPKQFAIDHA